MARYDKYNPISGGFRAPLNADLTATEDTGVGNPIAVSLNSTGKVVANGVGGSGVVGVLCTTRNMKAGEIVDVMTHGEIVECATPLNVAGEEVTATATSGALGVAAVAAGIGRVGHTVEVGRLVVRINGGIF